ncbi:MAG: DUF4062 domain-containing protein [Pseudomonadota bacterium]
MADGRHLKVMVSSTYKNLVAHRAAVIKAINGVQFVPIVQETDSALGDSDLIKASLDKVDACEIFVCLIGNRYGQQPVCEQRNPNGLSLTELEYRRAVAQGKTRFVFTMGDEHLLTKADLNDYAREGADAHQLLAAFIADARKDRVRADFISVDNLEAQVTNSLNDFLRKQESGSPDSAVPLPERPNDPDWHVPTKPPGFHFVRQDYIPNRPFAGRISELEIIDAWATGDDAMLLFQAIGGMGKSMLTSHWVKTRADNARSDWAGKFWYSFYEQGANLHDFLVQALAYIRHEQPRTFRDGRTTDLGAELRRELDAAPWLLVMDGMERILVAYNRTGKAHMSDEEAETTDDPMSLDRAPRETTRPDDADVLRLLAQASQGKLLASSRLVPAALTSDGVNAIHGVRHEPLAGLEPEDAEVVLRNAKVRGDGRKMRDYLKDKFACHPLSVGVVAGQISRTFEVRGDFDRWVESPNGGADPEFITKDLRGRQNHILAVAFDALTSDQQDLLGCLALVTVELTPDIVNLLNPKRPLAPEPVAPPERLTDETVAPDAPLEHLTLLLAREKAESDAEREQAQQGLDAYRDDHLREQKDVYGRYVSEREVWQRNSAEADAAVRPQLVELEALGLMQFDLATAAIDIHPAVRHTAVTQLGADGKSRAGSHVSDALASSPVVPFEQARSVTELTVVMDRVRALCEAGQLEAGWEVYKTGLRDALYRLGANHERLEMLRAWFPTGWNENVALPKSEHALAFNQAGVVLADVGQNEASGRMGELNLASDLAIGDISNVAISCRNLSIRLRRQDQPSTAFKLLTLVERLADLSYDEHSVVWSQLTRAEHLLRMGDTSTAAQSLPSESSLVSSSGDHNALAAYIACVDAELAERTGVLTDDIAQKKLQTMRDLGDRPSELGLLCVCARWRQEHDDHQRALDDFNEAVALANDMRQPVTFLAAWRALSLARLNQHDEARRSIENLKLDDDGDDVSLALVHLELGDTEIAKDHALKGYT